jgi:hypothetical protein
VPSHDPKLARALRGYSLERLPTLWDQFDALAHIPLMVIRGANSDMLARSTLNEMLVRRGQLEVVVVPDQGHAPLLAEPKVIRRAEGGSSSRSGNLPKGSESYRPTIEGTRVVYSRRLSALELHPYPAAHLLID